MLSTLNHPLTALIALGGFLWLCHYAHHNVASGYTLDQRQSFNRLHNTVTYTEASPVNLFKSEDDWLQTLEDAYDLR